MTGSKSILVLAFVLAGCGQIDPNAALKEAAASMESRDYRTATIRVRNVLQIEPDNAEAHLLRGRIAVALGDYQTAVTEIGRARELGASQILTALDLAEAFLHHADHASALKTLDAVALELGDRPSYWQLRAEALLQIGSVDDAALALERVVTSEGTSPRYLVARARLAIANGALTEAEQLLAEAASIVPTDPDAKLAFGDFLVRANRLHEAAAPLSGASDIYSAEGRTSRAAVILVGLVQVHVAINDLDAAQSATDQLAAIAPNASATAYVRGLLEYREGRFDKAAGYLQEAVIAQPGNAQALTLLGAVQLALGNFGQAEQHLLTVLSANAADPAAIKLLAEVRLRHARPEAALETLRPLAGTGIQDPKVGLLTGLANLSAGKPEEGLLYLEQASSLDPTDQVLRFELARAYSALGRHEEAAKALNVDLGAVHADDSLGSRFNELLVYARRSDLAGGTHAAADLVARSPRDAEALTAAALYYQVVNERVRARELLETAVDVDGSFVAARLLLAGAFTQENRMQEAERQLRQVLLIQPSNAQALTGLAQLALERDDFDGAETLLRQSLEHSTGPQPRLILTRLYINRGRLADANRLISEAAAVAPDDPEVIATQGLVKLAAGRFEEAAVLLENARAHLGNRLGVVLALAEAQLQNGAGENSRSTLRSALAAAPQSLPLRVALGTVELRLGNVDDVSSIARRLQAEFPARAEGYALEGEANIARRRYDLAAQNFRTAYEQEESWRLLSRLVDAMRLAETLDDVIPVLEDWSTRYVNDVPSRLLLADVYRVVGRDREALSQYDRVLQAQDDNVVALNNAAWLHHLARDPRALQLAESAYRLAPESAAVLDTLGTILLAENRDQDAVAHLERAAELAPNAPEIRYHLAQAQVELRRLADARATLEGLLRDNRPFEGRAAAEELLNSL